jgi:LysM repeat protein
MSFVVSTLLAFALAATVLAAALLVGLFPTGPGGVAVSTTRPPSSFPVVQPTATTSTPAATAEPTSTLPASIPPEGTTYEVKPGDALSLIGERFGIPWQLIAEANAIEGPDYVIVPGQVLIIPSLPEPSAGADSYFVQAGDSITSIAEQFGVSPTDLADFNNIADWNTIQVGQLLHIPGPGWTPLPTPSP